MPPNGIPIAMDGYYSIALFCYTLINAGRRPPIHTVNPWLVSSSESYLAPRETCLLPSPVISQLLLFPCIGRVLSSAISLQRLQSSPPPPPEKVSTAITLPIVQQLGSLGREGGDPNLDAPTGKVVRYSFLR